MPASAGVTIAMQSYIESVEFLYSLTPQPRFGLERMEHLLCALGNPQKKYKVFHVAGTNGKGSTCAFLTDLLQAKGYKVGLYTSPHLTCIRERIRIHRELIPLEVFKLLVQTIQAIIAKWPKDERPTFFEAMTAMSALHFAQQKVDFAVIEVGMGGRLDATNLFEPIVSIITPIGYDHCAFLGETLEQIAIEKAGIIKAKVPVVLARANASLLPGITKKADEMKAAIVMSAEAVIPVKTGIQGCSNSLDPRFREDDSPVMNANSPNDASLRWHDTTHPSFLKENFSLAKCAVEIAGISIDDALSYHVLNNFIWPARFEWFEDKKILLDGAHNPLGAELLAQSICTRWPSREPQWNLLIGMTQGHNEKEFIRNLNLNSWCKHVFVTAPNNPRALSPHELATHIRNLYPHLEIIIVSASSIFFQNILLSSTKAPLCVTGSLYLVGEMRSALTPMPKDIGLKGYALH